MPKIFLSLSIVSLALVASALIYGLLGGDYNGVSQQLRESASAADRAVVLAELAPIQKHVRMHVMLGILASLIAVLVQSIGVTYFIGTGRWCKEVAEAYHLDDSFLHRSSHVKRMAFPFAMLGMGTILLISAFGAAADPGTLRETTAGWVKPHYWAAIIGLGVLAFALWKQVSALQTYQQLIEEILAAVKVVRVSKGLDVAEEDIAEEDGAGGVVQGGVPGNTAQELA